MKKFIVSVIAFACSISVAHAAIGRVQQDSSGSKSTTTAATKQQVASYGKVNQNANMAAKQQTTQRYAPNTSSYSAYDSRTYYPPKPQTSGVKTSTAVAIGAGALAAGAVIGHAMATPTPAQQVQPQYQYTPQVQTPPIQYQPQVIVRPQVVQPQVIQPQVAQEQVIQPPVQIQQAPQPNVTYNISHNQSSGGFGFFSWLLLIAAIAGGAYVYINRKYFMKLTSGLFHVVPELQPIRAFWDIQQAYADSNQPKLDELLGDNVKREFTGQHKQELKIHGVSFDIMDSTRTTRSVKYTFTEGSEHVTQVWEYEYINDAWVLNGLTNIQ